MRYPCGEKRTAAHPLEADLVSSIDCSGMRSALRIGTSPGL